MNKIKTIYDKKEVEVWAQKLNGNVWFHYAGESFCYTPESSRASKSSSKSTEPGVIKAPMPGKIIKLKIEVGDQVTKGQTLVAMEAMKMEYSLEADINGTIKELNIEVNQQVDLGQVLVNIEAIDES